MTDRVVLVDETYWRFDDKEPVIYLKREGDKPRWGTSVRVDPFPAYHHDLGLVREVLDQVSAILPMPESFSPTVYVLKNEVISRTNAQAGIDFDYDWKPATDEEKESDNARPWFGHIVLSAKRIPPHPAMTRYLVAHEYGHVVEEWIARGKGYRPNSNPLLTEYAELRGLGPDDYVHGASGGNWHRSIAEIFANDFRLMRTGLEPEFWPHDVPRPAAVPAIHTFWRDAR